MRGKGRAVPAVQRVSGRLGRDEIAAVGVFLVDRTQVHRHQRGDRRRDMERNAAECRRERAVEMATMDGEDLPPPIDRRAEALDPGLVGRWIHPVDAAYDWRVVYEDCRRHVRRFVERGHEPGLPRLAERSAVTTGFGRIEQDYTQAL